MLSGFYYDTPIGKIGIAENGTHITHLSFNEFTAEDINIIETSLIKKAILELNEYFTKKRKIFNLPLAPDGTEFQKKVWSELCKIPYGTTCSYKDIARAIGNEKACRAVGMANNKNPIAIFIPCHRVIGSNGKLVGYAGGIDIKKKLLNMEKENCKYS